jgi:hypothetical protein
MPATKATIDINKWELLASIENKYHKSPSTLEKCIESLHPWSCSNGQEGNSLLRV